MKTVYMYFFAYFYRMTFKKRKYFPFFLFFSKINFLQDFKVFKFKVSFQLNETDLSDQNYFKFVTLKLLFLLLFGFLKN